MTIHIVRHGETEENKQRILQGHMPGTLTEEGKEQVRLTAEELAKKGVKYKYIVASDLKRTMDSAQIIADKLNIPILPNQLLRERDWGSYTGIPISEARDKYCSDGKWNFPITDNPIETEDEISDRARKALDTLYDEYKDDDIVVVTHGMFARFLIAVHFGCHFKEVTPMVNAEIRTLKVGSIK